MDYQLARATLKNWNEGLPVAEKQLYKAAEVLDLNPKEVLREARFNTILDGYLARGGEMLNSERAYFSNSLGSDFNQVTKLGSIADELILRSLLEVNWTPDLRKLAFMDSAEPDGIVQQQPDLREMIQNNPDLIGQLVQPDQQGQIMARPTPSAPQQLPPSPQGNYQQLLWNEQNKPQIEQQQEEQMKQQMLAQNPAPQGNKEQLSMLYQQMTAQEKVQHSLPQCPPEQIEEMVQKIEQVEQQAGTAITDPKQIQKIYQEIAKLQTKKVDEAIKQISQQAQAEMQPQQNFGPIPQRLQQGQPQPQQNQMNPQMQSPAIQKQANFIPRSAITYGLVGGLTGGVSGGITGGLSKEDTLLGGAAKGALAGGILGTGMGVYGGHKTNKLSPHIKQNLTNVLKDKNDLGATLSLAFDPEYAQHFKKIIRLGNNTMLGSTILGTGMGNLKDGLSYLSNKLIPISTGAAGAYKSKEKNANLKNEIINRITNGALGAGSGFINGAATNALLPSNALIGAIKQDDTALDALKRGIRSGATVGALHGGLEGVLGKNIGNSRGIVAGAGTIHALLGKGNEGIKDTYNRLKEKKAEDSTLDKTKAYLGGTIGASLLSAPAYLASFKGKLKTDDQIHEYATEASKRMGVRKTPSVLNFGNPGSVLSTPDDNLIMTNSRIPKATIGHEVGHTKNYQWLGDKMKNPLKALAMVGGLRTIGRAGSALGSIHSAVEDEPSYGGAIASGISNIPTLIDEGAASFHALKDLKRTNGMKSALKGAVPLGLGFGSYLAQAASPLLVKGLRHKIRNDKEKEAGIVNNLMHVVPALSNLKIATSQRFKDRATIERSARALVLKNNYKPKEMFASWKNDVEYLNKMKEIPIFKPIIGNGDVYARSKKVPEVLSLNDIYVDPPSYATGGFSSNEKKLMTELRAGELMNELNMPVTNLVNSERDRNISSLMNKINSDQPPTKTISPKEIHPPPTQKLVQNNVKNKIFNGRNLGIGAGLVGLGYIGKKLYDKNKPKEKTAWSWEGFKEGVKDEGIPLSGAIVGAALGHRNPLRGAALGYLGGSAASVGSSLAQGKEITPGQALLAASGAGYGLGALGHMAGAKYLPNAAIAGRKLFQGHGMLQSGIEEAMPAVGATLGAGVGSALTHKKEKAAPIVSKLADFQEWDDGSEILKRAKKIDKDRCFTINKTAGLGSLVFGLFKRPQQLASATPINKARAGMEAMRDATNLSAKARGMKVDPYFGAQNPEIQNTLIKQRMGLGSIEQGMAPEIMNQANQFQLQGGMKKLTNNYQDQLLNNPQFQKQMDQVALRDPSVNPMLKMQIEDLHNPVAKMPSQQTIRPPVDSSATSQTFLPKKVVPGPTFEDAPNSASTRSMRINPKSLGF